MHDGALNQHLQRLLAYHGWAYARLLRALDAIDEAHYRAPSGLFFGSPHGTLNHLAVADRIWLARVRGEAPPFTRLDAEAVSERMQMDNYLQQGVAAWRNLLDGYTDTQLLQPVAYRNMAGELFQRPLLDIVTHLVNHGTHHRGQITAALTAIGQPAPTLDYIYALSELP